MNSKIHANNLEFKIFSLLGTTFNSQLKYYDKKKHYDSGSAKWDSHFGRQFSSFL